MIVADTSAWIDYLKGVDAPHTGLLDRELPESRIIIGDIIIAELLQGFKDEKDYRRAKSIVEILEYRDFLGKENSYKAAQNFRKLRRKGITVRKTIDVIIATFCVENNFQFIHNDRDYDPMERHLGLQVRR